MPPTAYALAGPVRRLIQTSESERAASTLAGIFAFLWSPIFWVGYGTLFILNCLDFALGVRVAGADYDGDRALNGAISKLTALILLFVLHVLEHWAPAAAAAVGVDVAGTRGALAFAATCALILVEIRSIGAKTQALGTNSLGPLLSALDKLFNRGKQGQ